MLYLYSGANLLLALENEVACSELDSIMTRI